MNSIIGGPKQTLIQVLVQEGALTSEQVKQIADYAEENFMTHEEALKELDIISKERVLESAARREGFEFVHIDELEIKKETLELLDPDIAIIYPVLPISWDDMGSILTVAVPLASAPSMQLVNDIKNHITAVNVISVNRVVATKEDILKGIETLYSSSGKFAALAKDKEASASKQATANARKKQEADVVEEDLDPMVRFVNMVLESSLKHKASDIHFDPVEDGGYLIRLRVDGIMQQLTHAPEAAKANIASIMKIKSNLDIAKTRETQDGRISETINGRAIDFRMVTIPAVGGEKIVLRVLDNSAAELPLDKLGFRDENLEKIMSVAKKPYGAMIVCGPTGSGKSTTLYSTLNAVKTPDINILTVEDPVEYELEGITQIPVTQSLSFDAALRASLRADPDVILIGEIRDNKTAETVMKASATGHLVFSTLHTNDASSTLTRLVDMDVAPYVIGSTVEGIIAQRLIRRLCLKCRKPAHYDNDFLEKIGFPTHLLPEGSKPTFYEAAGCKQCNQTGYKGRLGIHEVLLVSDKIERAIIDGKSSLDIETIAIEEGMVPMRDDGFLKSAQGITSIDEIMRITTE